MHPLSDKVLSVPEGSRDPQVSVVQHDLAVDLVDEVQGSGDGLSASQAQLHVVGELIAVLGVLALT